MKKVLEEHYDNGQLSYRWNYLNNKPHGMHTGWSTDGSILYRFYYINGKLCGVNEPFLIRYKKYYRLL